MWWKCKLEKEKKIWPKLLYSVSVSVPFCGTLVPPRLAGWLAGWPIRWTDSVRLRARVRLVVGILQFVMWLIRRCMYYCIAGGHHGWFWFFFFSFLFLTDWIPNSTPHNPPPCPPLTQSIIHYSLTTLPSILLRCGNKYRCGQLFVCSIDWSVASGISFSLPSHSLDCLSHMPAAGSRAHKVSRTVLQRDTWCRCSNLWCVCLCVCVLLYVIPCPENRGMHMRKENVERKWNEKKRRQTAFRIRPRKTHKRKKERKKSDLCNWILLVIIPKPLRGFLGDFLPERRVIELGASVIIKQRKLVAREHVAVRLGFEFVAHIGDGGFEDVVDFGLDITFCAVAGDFQGLSDGFGWCWRHVERVSVWEVRKVKDEVWRARWRARWRAKWKEDRLPLVYIDGKKWGIRMICIVSNNNRSRVFNSRWYQ